MSPYFVELDLILILDMWRAEQGTKAAFEANFQDANISRMNWQVDVSYAFDVFKKNTKPSKITWIRSYDMFHEVKPPNLQKFREIEVTTDYSLEKSLSKDAEEITWKWSPDRLQNLTMEAENNTCERDPKTTCFRRSRKCLRILWNLMLKKITWKGWSEMLRDIVFFKD